jgi:hypothetical protein
VLPKKPALNEGAEVAVKEDTPQEENKIKRQDTSHNKPSKK